MISPDELSNKDRALVEETFMVLGMLHEAVSSFSRQRSLEDLWVSVCRNARWIVPCQRMAVLLGRGARECSVVARIEAGQMLDGLTTGFDAGEQLTGSLLANKGVQWFTDLQQYASERDELHQWLLKEQPQALISVPLKLEQTPVGALVFVLDSHKDADQALLNALIIGYSLYVGMTYSLLNTMTKLQAARQQQDLLLTEIEAKNTELEERNVDIESQNRVLESQNAELERFTYTVSHDLKSPLVTISGFLGLLQKDITAEDDKAIEGDLKQIGSATGKMAQLLNDLLELSRIGRLMNDPEDVSLSRLARDMAGKMVMQLEERGIEIDIADDMPSVFGDPGRLSEVFQNLLDNAIKFMGEQKAPKIEIGAHTDDGEIHCYVRDNGIGIAPDYHQQLFGLFDRLDLSVDGSGIGLALVKRIVEVHGGQVWVESAGEGHGSTFWFTIPLDASQSVCW
ncbi:MAG: GHKL domain-containing protein [Gammaproteobacteria bacterium]|nr:GHKL domain-containing protein [Gammaproteobacteria bacterium]